jgi:outer membrane protein OmpA-like peptidoglycan-associated protein
MARLTPVVAIVATASLAFAEATVPTADRRGAKDSPLLKRYEGSLIVAHEEKGFAEFTLPLSRLEQVPRRTDGRNNRYHEPRDKRVLDGRYTRLVYLIPENRSPLEVLQNYQGEIKGKRGRILFECKVAECGGDPRKSNVGGGGDMSLAMYLYPSERITERSGSTGYCAVAAHRIADQRYAAAEIPDSGAHVSVLAYTVVAPGQHDPCRAFNARTIAIVDIVEAKAREQKMVTVQAGDMAKAISGEGRVALYGIYFDFNKAEIKPESDPTLEQIARLLKDAPQLKLLVVGHTDNVGTFAFNTELSQRRAGAVVNALATRFGIGRDRLTSVGVSFASPVASNKTEEGRAKNRRVELVEG